MNIVIAGGGEIGKDLAEVLGRGHDVTVLDVRQERARALSEADCRFLVGDGADPEDLRLAGTAASDAFIACTDSDDVNVIACLAAKGLGTKKTLAFVARERYVEAFAKTGALAGVGLMIDHVLWPQRPLAQQIAELARIPRALTSASVAGGRLKLLEYRLEDGDPFVGRPLARAELPEDVLAVASIRGEGVTIPSGETVLYPGDKVVFLGLAAGMASLAAGLTPRRGPLRVVVIGGGNVGFLVAEGLGGARTRLTLIERDRGRGEVLAQRFPHALVLLGDGTDPDLLEEEQLDESDVLIAVTDDSSNLMASLLAKHYGIPKIITRVGTAKNRNVFARIGVDTILTPREAAVTEVLNWLDLAKVERLASVEDRVDFLEVHLPPDYPGGALRDLRAPARSLVGAVLREGEAVIPRGSTLVRPGDHLVVVTKPEDADAVRVWLERGPARPR